MWKSSLEQHGRHPLYNTYAFCILQALEMRRLYNRGRARRLAAALKGQNWAAKRFLQALAGSLACSRTGTAERDRQTRSAAKPTQAPAPSLACSRAETAERDNQTPPESLAAAGWLSKPLPAENARNTISADIQSIRHPGPGEDTAENSSAESFQATPPLAQKSLRGSHKVTSCEIAASVLVHYNWPRISTRGESTDPCRNGPARYTSWRCKSSARPKPLTQLLAASKPGQQAKGLLSI